jgi:hypothetical protein
MGEAADRLPGATLQDPPDPAPDVWKPWMIYGTFASLPIPLLHPVLFLPSWPLLSTIFARALYLNLAAAIQDSFHRILVGTLLAMLAGVLALCLLFAPLVGGWGIGFTRWN